MAAAALLRSVAGKMMLSRAAQRRGLESRTSTDLPPKVLHTTAVAKARAGVAYIALFGSAIYLHFWVKPAQEKEKAMFETVCKQRSDLINCLQDIIHEQQEMLLAKRQKNTHVSSVSQTPSTLASGHVNATDQGTGVLDKLGKEDHVKELEATVMDLKAEIAELKIALDSSRSQGN